MSLAQRYYDEGADEVTLLKPNPSPDQVTFLNIPNPNPNPSPTQVTFLNITGFRDCPLTDLPMLKVRGLAPSHPPTPTPTLTLALALTLALILNLGRSPPDGGL